MGKIFYVMGKSSSGKDTIFRELMKDETLELQEIVLYTHMDLKRKDYLAIGTLVSYEKMRAYYGEEQVLPIYVEVPDDIRLIRAIDREKKQEKPAYEEMCRRFLADSEDFSEENLEKTGISRRFSNAGTLEECLTEIRQFIKEKKGFTNFS